MAGGGIEPPPEAYETSVLPLHSPTRRGETTPDLSTYQNLNPRPVVNTGE